MPFLLTQRSRMPKMSQIHEELRVLEGHKHMASIQGRKALHVFTTKSTGISGHSFTTAAFRASTLKWEVAQAFLSTVPQIP